MGLDNVYRISQTCTISNKAFWAMDQGNINILANMCDIFSAYIQRTLTMQPSMLFNASYQEWARAMLDLLPDMGIGRCITFEQALQHAEDASFAEYKLQYMPHVDWLNAYAPWVTGDGNCMFNSTVAVELGRGMFARGSALQHAQCLWLACVLCMIAEVEQFHAFCGMRPELLAGKISSKTHVQL
jgi:hypothetical protein